MFDRIVHKKPSHNICTCNIFQQSHIPLQVLLDSEGIESRGQSDQYMAQLFSMCILFSSTFVYNHMGLLDASLIEELSVAATVLQDITAGAALLKISGEIFKRP